MKHHYHWPENETNSGLNEAKKRDLERIISRIADGAAFGVGFFFAGACWAGFVAIVKYLIH